MASAAASMLVACSEPGVAPVPGRAGDASSRSAAPREERGVPILGYEIVAEHPHDPRAYTQGLLVADGVMYESTGQRGESGVRAVDIATGEVLKNRPISPQLFGEGLASVGGLLIQLTWTSGQALVFQRKGLVPAGYAYRYEGEGWGLTSMGDELVMSDGSDELRILDPKGMKETRRVRVTAGGVPVDQLNELEFIDGEIWANVWKSDRIARIDPATGDVVAWVDLSGLLGRRRVRSPLEDVLNGIAHDEDSGKIYVTGKRWPVLFEIRVVE
ncbi:MAG: glutaminyl-peptide cyclotransferase [Planctomycetota bacterium]|nr:glutaminyl-peptide cyclotransferase [Planctomycetota bacterium]